MYKNIINILSISFLIFFGGWADNNPNAIFMQDIKNCIKTKSDQNKHQNAPECINHSKFSKGACPRTP